MDEREEQPHRDATIGGRFNPLLGQKPLAEAVVETVDQSLLCARFMLTCSRGR